VDVELSDEQAAFAAAIRDFCARTCGTPEQRRRLTGDHAELHSHEVYAQLADLGWLGVGIEEAHGGAGGGMVEACVFLEETAHGLLPINGYLTTLIVARTVQRFGSPEQQDAVLGRIAAGAVQAIAMTEPDAGSDVGALTTAAVRTDAGFVINGEKVFCSNAHICSHVLVVCRTTRGERKHDGLSMLFVPADHPGMDVRRIDTLGGRETSAVAFTDVEVGPDAVLGAVDGGWTQLMAGLDGERLIIAAAMLGLGRRAFDDALAYVKERRQFGRPIGSFQVLQHRLADLATELAAARLLTYAVARQVDAEPAVRRTRESSMAKLYVTEAARRTALAGMQMLGGYGYASEYDMERLVRQALVATIYGGTSEIQRSIIARSYGL